MKYKAFLITIILSAIYNMVFAQTAEELAVKRATDSIKAVFISEYAKRYPILRQGSFGADIIGAGHVKGELLGNDIYDGDVKTTRLRSTFNFPVSQWGKNNISATLNYLQQHSELHNIRSYSPDFSNANFNLTKATVSFSASFTRSDSLFSYPVNFSGTISGMTDEISSIKRLNYLGSISVPVNRTQYSAFTVGLIILIDPSAPLPLFPIISYWHKYKSSGMELYADLPSRIILRKELSKRSWASLGTEFVNTLYFFDLNQPYLPQSSINATLEFRSGATFEYLLGKKLILGVNGGLLTTASSRMTDRNDGSSDYFYKTSSGSVPFISFSVSFLPFLKNLL